MVLDRDADAGTAALTDSWAAGTDAEPIEVEGLTAWVKPGALPVEDRSEAAPDGAPEAAPEAAAP